MSPPRPRILILGASGQLGRALVDEAAQQGIQAQALRREQIDFSKPELIRTQLAQYAEAFAPTHVINATAYTAVDRAEFEPELAMRVNADSVAELGHACGALGLPLIHFSTDYVFNGRLPLTEAYSPDHPTDPQSVYGATKRAGEVELMACSANVIVFRTSWVYAAHGSNFFQTMVSAAQKRGPTQCGERPVRGAHIRPLVGSSGHSCLCAMARRLKNSAPDCLWSYPLVRFRPHPSGPGSAGQSQSSLASRHRCAGSGGVHPAI